MGSARGWKHTERTVAVWPHNTACSAGSGRYDNEEKDEEDDDVVEEPSEEEELEEEGLRVGDACFVPR